MNLTHPPSPSRRRSAWRASTLFPSLLLAVAAGVGGCGSSDGKEQYLPEITPIAEGDANCPAGGTRIRAGEDTNGNGVLDDDEVAQETVICNQPSAVVVTRTTDIDPGTDCEFGGQRIEVGLDNGDSGGTADNGTLEDGEVDTSFLDCAELPMVVEVEPPTGDPGSFVLDTHGGAGGVGGGAGGGAGDVRVSDSESGGRNAFIMLSPNGAADASCTVPTLTVALGTQPGSDHDRHDHRVGSGRDFPGGGRALHSLDEQPAFRADGRSQRGDDGSRGRGRRYLDHAREHVVPHADLLGRRTHRRGGRARKCHSGGLRDSRRSGRRGVDSHDLQ